jgi:two-component system NtrC family sensor kinase
MSPKTKRALMGHKSIGRHLLLNFSVAILIPSLIICLVGVRIIYHRVVRQAQSEVVSNLRSARRIYDHYLDRIKSVIRFTALRFFISDAVEKKNKEIMQAELQRVLKDEKLDILTVTDAAGVVLLRARNPEMYGDTQSQNKMVARAIETEGVVAGTAIIPREELLKESQELAAEAYMEFTPTAKAKKRAETKETSGMMLMAAAPIFDHEGKFIGVLYGGRLINRDYEIVDEIKQTVFGNETYKGREIGTATIFEHDLRISTNVKNKDGTRATATRVSEQVYDAVLVRGKTWMDEAFVVNDWYITAYEPIYDLEKNIIGILYVGVLKRPYTVLLWNTLFIFLGAALLGIVIVILVSIRASRHIAAPLMQMASVAQKIANGDYNPRAEIKRDDEIGYLAEAWNQMTDNLVAAQRSLENWGRELEKKVREATDEVKRMERQVCQADKLSSLGKLAAGVAHEINNPLTAVLTNASLMLEELKDGDPKKEDLETIVRETIRCRQIVRGLLDFARQRTPEKTVANINQLIENMLQLLQNQIVLQNIEVHKQLDNNLPRVSVDADQIQQVLMNITLNAIEAMPRGGRLTIESKLLADGKISVAITDTGVGIKIEDVKNLFDPFFTTKSSGTGLGLAISHGIVHQHGGQIKVHSHLHEGSTFTVILPINSAADKEG